MKILTVILLALLIALQWPLWLGEKGSWKRVRELETALQEQRSANAKLIQRNQSMAAEVADLKNGTEAMEERARNQLGMIKKDEVFVQIMAHPEHNDPGATPIPTPEPQP